MNIVIPEKYKDLQIPEEQWLIVAFLLMISHEHGWETPYNINTYDFKKILGGSFGTLEPHTSKLKGLREMIEIKRLNDHNWTIQFRDFNRPDFYRYKDGSGNLRTAHKEITNVRCISMWCYLVGMYRGNKNLITDSERIFEYESAEATIDGTCLTTQNFRIDINHANAARTRRRLLQTE
jgi:hypothetical protein